jgi:hypothetical protein
MSQTQAVTVLAQDREQCRKIVQKVIVYRTAVSREKRRAKIYGEGFCQIAYTLGRASFLLLTLAALLGVGSRFGCQFNLSSIQRNCECCFA